MKHLAIFKGDTSNKILQGVKLIESRFSKVKSAPFGAISVGDLVYIKPSGKDIIGQFRVKKVITFEGLNSDDLEEIKNQYGKEIASDEDFWRAHLGAKYGTLIFIGETSPFLTAPIKFAKKDLRGWVVLK